MQGAGAQKEPLQNRIAHCNYWSVSLNCVDHYGLATLIVDPSKSPNVHPPME